MVRQPPVVEGLKAKEFLGEPEARAVQVLLPGAHLAGAVKPQSFFFCGVGLSDGGGRVSGEAGAGDLFCLVQQHCSREAAIRVFFLRIFLPDSGCRINLH